jgi:lysozyme
MFVYSKSGLALTESFEGCRFEAYLDQNGIPTIGYGHTGPEVHLGLIWTQEQCDAALEGDIAWAASVVNRCVTYPINQDEFDALTDFCFNVGSGNFEKSTLLKELNSGNLSAAAAQFDEWDHASGKVVAGLLRRRTAEQHLFQN